MLFVAEIGLNHDGNFDLVHEMIRQAKFAGADIAKFQLGWRDKPGEINQIDPDRAKRLMRWCDYWEIEFLASIITPAAFEMARSLGMRRFKIASRTVVDHPALCQEILGMGRETFVSLGMWQGEGFPFGPPTDRLRYVYCRSKYPCYPEDMRELPTRFSTDGWYGYSDHLHGIEGCLLAMARGARYIEKHFTFDKTSQVIRDHALSATPDEFRTLVQAGRALGNLVRAIE